MIILGLDPGVRNIGLALLDSKGYTLRTMRVSKGDWTTTYLKVIEVLEGMQFDAAVIESVGWYGARRGMYALNRLVGALWAYIRSRTGNVRLVMPNQKPKLNYKTKRRAKTEHEADALALAVLGARTWLKTLKLK